MKKLLIKIGTVLYSLKECITVSNLKHFVTDFNNAELIDVWHCLYGTYIDKLYWDHRDLLHPMDVLQLEFRHRVMNQECLNRGTCKECGCTTTALQAAKKQCRGGCYPYWIRRDMFATLYTVTRLKNSESIDTMQYEVVLRDSIIKLWFNKNNNVNV